MANVMTPGNFHPRRINQYVPKMQLASDVHYGGSTRISFGPVAAGNTNNVVNAQSLVAAATLDLSGLPDVVAPWGRCVTLTGSANVIAGSAITLRGWDYLGQPMAEVFTSVAGVTAIVGLKAFKTFNSVTFALNAGTAPVTMSIGQNTKLGLPYRAIAARLETASGAPTGTQGTLAAGPIVAPTNAVGQPDPRGTYTPFTTMTGATTITAHFDFANDTFLVGATEVCGLMGFPHA